eukprot:13621901-Alexandrium_andersonii.AAC.1
MRGALWKCSELQRKLATSEEARGAEVRNELLEDMRAGLRDFPGRRQFTDVAVEGDPPVDERPTVRTSETSTEAGGSRPPR